MGKDKLRKFKENETFSCLVQPRTDEVFGKDHPLKGHWGEKMFGNDRPIVVELGCGKGEYTIDLALRNPGCNYIGVDIKGARLWKGAKYATEHSLPNVAFLRTRIEFIESLFAPEEVSEIWITFADPQIGREKKRLTSPLFLSRYRNFLKKGGIVHLKTDSRYLHEYTRAIAGQNGLEILACTSDLYGRNTSASTESFFEKKDKALQPSAPGQPSRSGILPPSISGLPSSSGIVFPSCHEGFPAGMADVIQLPASSSAGSDGIPVRETIPSEPSSESYRQLMASPLASVCGSDAIDALFQVQTFYETQYLSQGIPITYMAFRIDHQGPYLSPEWDPDQWER